MFPDLSVEGAGGGFALEPGCCFADIPVAVDGVHGDDVDCDVVGVVAPVGERDSSSVAEDEVGPGGAAMVAVESVSDLELRYHAVAEFGNLPENLLGKS